MASDLVQIGSFPTPVAAELARARLAAEGIRAFLTNEIGSSAGGGGVGLQVAALDADRALALLASPGSAADPRKDEAAVMRCVMCRSAELERVDWPLPLRILRAIFLMAVPLPPEWFGGSRVRCRVCGHESALQREGQPGPGETPPDARHP